VPPGSSRTTSAHDFDQTHGRGVASIRELPESAAAAGANKSASSAILRGTMTPSGLPLVRAHVRVPPATGQPTASSSEALDAEYRSRGEEGR
jgi:hypothetical protein